MATEGERLYYYSDGENTYGPYSLSDLESFARDGYVTESTYIWVPERNEWKLYSEMVSSGVLSREPVVTPEVVETASAELFSFNCAYHPDIASDTICVDCDKNLCQECAVISGGLTYCRECAPVSSTVRPDTGSVGEPETQAVAAQGEPDRKNKRSNVIRAFIYLGLGLVILAVACGMGWYFYNQYGTPAPSTSSGQNMKIRITQ